ncbi:BnaCnng46580D [Brassica napus]|uniref:cellulase n=1 Tax=Brassica napus TaxID=3708 RepID=A0A078JFT4_BRANA|nr:BnaCnng46580D [Brassica napus]
MAAASMVFREVDSEYPLLLLAIAKSVMQFTIQYRGNCSDSPSSSLCPLYCSYSAYVGWAWLLKATNDLYYKNMGAGAYVLLSQRALLNKDINFELCKILPDARSSQTLPLSLPITLKLPQSNPQYNRHNILAHNLHQVHESHTTHIRLRKLRNHRPFIFVFIFFFY